MKKKNGFARGFTLIELMVVVTVIGILAAIIIPSIAGALKGGKKARAMSQIRDLDGAVKRYYAEYGKMPVPRGDNGGNDKLYTGSAQAAVIEILINANAEMNPKQIVFLDVEPSALVSGVYQDPWGGDYGILMDLNFDEKIDNLGGFGEIRAKVAVYSGGENQDVVHPPYRTW